MSPTLQTNRVDVTFDRLWAKSPTRDGWWHDSLLLSVHLHDVHQAANEVLCCTGADQLEAIGLSPRVHLERLRRIVLLAAALHDLGKANDHFQRMLRSPAGVRQGLRHEWVTLLIIQRPGWRSWLHEAVAEETDLDLVEWAIAGHHPAWGRASPPQRPDPQAGAGSTIRVLQGHDDFAACVDLLATTFTLSGRLPTCVDEVMSLREGAPDGAFALIANAFARARFVWEGMPDDSRRLLAVAKACLVAADVAGSALPRAGESMDWVARALSKFPSHDDLRRVISNRLCGKSMRPFQLEIGAQASRVTLARAGCGSGKTLAAYHWAAEQCPGRRIHYCYPTTGTATEGFRDYLFDTDVRDGRFGARLFHSRADVDRDVILAAGRDEDEAVGPDVVHRIQSLDAWATPIVTCTVDTVLGLIQNHRKGLYAWPVLARSAFVFDEIHAYDEKLFGALLRFLSTMRGARVLLMTASLPHTRLAALERCLSRNGEPLRVIVGPPELEGLPRYGRGRSVDPDDPTPEVRAELSRGGKVLWVCNLVDRVIAFAERCADLNPLVYHSRFRYVDRVDRHRAVIAAFDTARNRGPALAICTQVAEMSLDLSATLLVTDLAPVPAMIQRLGRLNRRAVPGGRGGAESATMPFIVVEPRDRRGNFTVLPYDTSDEGHGDWPTQSRAWLDRIGDDRISQAILAGAWEAANGAVSVQPCESKWLDGGPRTEVDTLRDTSPGITVVMERDLAYLRSGARRLVEVLIPMPLPHGLDWRRWERFNHIPVAPADTIEYHPERGGAWRR